MIRSILVVAAVLIAIPAAAQPGGLAGAVLAGNVVAVQTLIASGADVTEFGEMGTPLHVAAFTGNAEIARLLLDAGAQIEATTDPLGSTPLHVAASYDRLAVAALLLERRATSKRWSCPIEPPWCWRPSSATSR